MTENNKNMVKQLNATITIVNKSQNSIISLFADHKYSNVHQDEFYTRSTAITLPNATVGTMTVTYHVGFGTLGQDWFYLSWISMDQNGQFYFNEINPNNFRSIIDFSEKMICFPNYCDLYQTPEQNSKYNLIFNLESTVGFKKHCLRKSDSRYYNEISICDKNKMFFRSSSGTSDSVYNSKEIHFPMISLLMNSPLILTPPPTPAPRINNQRDFDIYVNQLIKKTLESNHDSVCTICLTENTVSDAVRHPGVCRGIFHSNCFQSLTTMGNSKCPLCRETIDLSQCYQIAEC
jgi:hypothetical protein